MKTNAPELLRKELARHAPDVICCGDWQRPAEERYGISRRMLEVVLEFGFPLLVIERSPFLLRDLDLLQEINQRSWAGVTLSFSNVDPVLKRVFEPRSPGLEQRLQMMEKIARAEILVGMNLMPILPVAGDDDAHLEAAVRAAKDHGASFVLAAGLTMAGAQAERTLAAAKRLDPALEAPWRKLYDVAGGRTAELRTAARLLISGSAGRSASCATGSACATASRATPATGRSRRTSGLRNGCS